MNTGSVVIANVPVVANTKLEERRQTPPNRVNQLMVRAPPAGLAVKIETRVSNVDLEHERLPQRF